MTAKDNQVYEGLEGIVAFESSISHIDGTVPELVIRGYDINDIVNSLTYEEMAYLLLHGDLPNPKQLAGFDRELKSLRRIPNPVLKFLSEAPSNSHPMSVLRTAVSMLGCMDSESDLSEQNSVLLKLKALIAQIPTIVAAQARINSGETPIEPDVSLSHSSNYYYMVAGEIADEKTLNAFDAILVIYAEHEINASTFACRVVMGTESDIYSSVVAGISAIKGPLHGGAIDGSMNMIKEIGCVENAENYVKDALAKKRKLPGFGHRVYRAGDPRAHVLKRMTLELANWYYISDILFMAKIQLNGDKFEVQHNTNLNQLLRLLKISSNKVAIELNGEIAQKHKYDKIFIKKNDKIEIVQFIGGG